MGIHAILLSLGLETPVGRATALRQSYLTGAAAFITESSHPTPHSEEKGIHFLTTLSFRPLIVCQCFYTAKGSCKSGAREPGRMWLIEDNLRGAGQDRVG